MRKCVIQNFLPNTMTVKLERNYEVEINPEWWPHLLLEKLLKLMGAKSIFERQLAFQKIEIDKQNFHRLVAKYVLDMYTQYGRPPSVILVGRWEYQQVIDYNSKYALEFDAQIPIHNNGHVRWLGYKVKLIPWMDGILPLMEDE